MITPLLKDKALKSLMDFVHSSPLSGWDQFKSHLKSIHTSVDNQWKLRMELSELRQKDNFERFLAKFKSLADQIQGLPETELLFLFLKALKPNTRKEVRARYPKTLKEVFHWRNMIKDV